MTKIDRLINVKKQNYPTNNQKEQRKQKINQCYLWAKFSDEYP